MKSNAPRKVITFNDKNTMIAKPIEINWHSGLPIFASESFLKAVGDEYGWLGGIDSTGKLRCILPYTIIRKLNFRLVRFRVETIPLSDGLSLSDEKLFLNSVIDYFRSIGADTIIPATTNTIFRTFPVGADAAPYGSYLIDLTLPEDILWDRIERITRQNINSAKKKGVEVKVGATKLDSVYSLISSTFGRSKIPFMGYDSFERFVSGLGQNALILTAEHQGIAQSHVVFASSDYCAYAIYAGNQSKQVNGANKLLYWEAIRLFKQWGVRRYDFVGARINPVYGGKEWAINSLKRHLGAELTEGYIWKYSLRPLRSIPYNVAVRFFKGGDIVDMERHKLQLTENSPSSSTS